MQMDRSGTALLTRAAPIHGCAYCASGRCPTTQAHRILPTQTAQPPQPLTVDVVLAAVQRGVKQVVGRLLKRRQHEHAVLHLGNAEPRDAQHLALRWSGRRWACTFAMVSSAAGPGARCEVGCKWAIAAVAAHSSPRIPPAIAQVAFPTIKTNHSAHLVGHAVGQQHHVPVVDGHAVRLHGGLDLVHNRLARRL